jgi:hypothetical protein
MSLSNMFVLEGRVVFWVVVVVVDNTVVWCGCEDQSSKSSMVTR